MRIAVVNLVSTDGGGWTVLRDLHRFAVNPRHTHDWLFVLGPQELDEGDRVRIARFPRAKAGPLGRLWVEAVGVGRAVRDFRPDVTVSLQNTLVLRVPGPQMVYLHQTLPFQTAYRFSFFRRREFESAVRQHLHGRLIRKSVAAADGVFVQTEWMREAVSRSVSGRTPVVNVGLPGLTDEVIEPEPSSGSASFFFYPAGPAVYKNFDRLHAAVRAATAAGATIHVKLTLEEHEFRRLARIRPAEPLDSYDFLGRITHAQVEALYRQSALVFPSYIETVGLPMLEARQHGRHIIASDRPFSREVLAGYPNVEFFDPFDPAALARAMLRVSRGEVSLHHDPEPTTQTRPSWQTLVDSLDRPVHGGRP
jgi:glycosyltransferase involved in cell wall biosynthesis